MCVTRFTSCMCGRYTLPRTLYTSLLIHITGDRRLISKGMVARRIGVTSNGVPGHVPSLDFQLFNFSGHFRAAQTLTFDSMWSPIQKKIQADSFVTVYCMNFIIFLRVTPTLFSLSFVPLLAPNPGDATASRPMV